MDLEFSKQGTTLIAKMAGEIDHHSASYVRHKIDSELLKPKIKNIIFDFSETSFMDSAGIGVIMGRYKNVVSAGGKVAIASLNNKIKKIFELSGLQRVIEVCDSLEGALKTM